MNTKRGMLIPPSRERIDKMNKYYHITLPNDYVSFIQEHNGEIPAKRAFSVNGREYAIDRFLCILDNPKENDDGIYDVNVVISQLDTRLIDDEELIGMNVIPIAVLFAGDFVCLDFRNSKEPIVVVWYHDESEDFEPITQKVASNFSEFLGMLTTE